MVIGGGIAGTAAALALHKAGFEVTVHEAHPDTGADIGAFLTLASNGMHALAQLDAAAPVADLGFPITGMSVIDETGARLAAIPLGEHERPLTRYRCLRRADLGAALQDEVRRRGIRIRHAARLTTVTESATGATATFADGSSASADLIVGADGLHSAVRAQLDPAATGPDYAGQRVFYGYTTAYDFTAHDFTTDELTADATPPPDAQDRITMVRGSGAALGYLVSPAGETFWFARVAGPALTAQEITGTTPRQWRDQLLPLLRPDRTPAADIVAATGDRLMATNALHLRPGNRWHSRRIVLIGDAAHAASPATGQGASMALEDAVVLAKALRDADTPGAALDSYEQHRRPRAERNLTVSAQLTASRTTEGDQAPGSTAPQARDSERPAARLDEELLQLLDWDAELPRTPRPA